MVNISVWRYSGSLLLYLLKFLLLHLIVVHSYVTVKTLHLQSRGCRSWAPAGRGGRGYLPPGNVGSVLCISSYSEDLCFEDDD